VKPEESSPHPYDDNDRYEKIEDGVYHDLKTNETVFVLNSEQQQQLAPILEQKRKEQEDQRSAKDRWDLFRAEVLLTLGIEPAISPSLAGSLEGSGPERLEDFLTRAAALGSDTALLRLGILCKSREQFEEAESWWSKAHEAGHERGSLNNAGMWESQGDLEKAREWLTKGAEAGHQDVVRRLISFAISLSDHELEEMWTQRLSELEKVESLARQEKLAGLKVEAKELKAKADRDDLEALVRLGLLNYNKLGKPKKARTIFERAAELGSGKAMDMLAFIAKWDDDDEGEAIKWYLAGAEAGEPSAQSSLGALLVEVGRADEGREWLEKAGSAGDIDAVEELAEMAFIEGDQEGATRLIAQAADLRKIKRSE
jgi:TPR repeat protein